ncbi:hypothetical protein VYU27_004216 [Nannochloropsis oceanica]
MVASALFIMDLKGKIIISRNFRGDIPQTVSERFAIYLQEKEESEQRPVFTEDGYTFAYLKYNNLFLLSVTKRNSNVALMLVYLSRLVDVFKEYFGELEEESIRDNFVIIYELMDETMDFGYPQTTEAKILREYITQEGNRLEAAPRPPVALTNTVSWRSEGIKHRKNEIFLDVIEKLNLLVSANGTVLHSEIVGAIRMKSFLSGMPELKLGLNDKLMFEAAGRSVSASTKGKAIELEDIKFHQCVRLARFENDRTISFIPPDGEFDLMTYRLSTQVKPLIWVEAVVEPHSHSRIEYMIKAKSQFKSRSIANNVDIIIPVPSDVDTPSFKASIGTVTYLPDKDAIVWSIKQFHGQREYLMRAHFGLPSIAAEGSSTSAAEKCWKKPVQIKFEIPYFTVSGIQVRYLKIIEKSGFAALPWVRYITCAGDVFMRMGT